MTDDDGPKVVFTTKELLQGIDTKLDRLGTQLEQKADQLRVESMVEAVRLRAEAEVARAFAEIARVEALTAPLLDPQTGVYALIESSSKKIDGKMIGALCAITMLLAGILLKKFIGLG